MEKGTLEISESKKGKIIVKAIINGKKVTIQNSGITDMSLNNKNAEFEREKGQVVKVVLKDRTIYSKRKTAQFSGVSSSRIKKSKAGGGMENKSIIKSDAGEMEMKHIKKISHQAKAPYNFIPLNIKVAEAEPIPDFNCYHPDRYTGWIDLNIETKTPIYIRDTLNRDEMKKQEKEKKKECRYNNSDFFSPGGILKIPGSSLRGMVRTLVEITSYGRFGAFDDKGLYFRGLADKSSLRHEYQSRMSSYKRQKSRTAYRMNAGFLSKKDGNKYFIQPSDGFEQISKKDSIVKIEKTGEKYKEFSFFKTKTGWIVVSGHMNNKKKEWLIYPPKSDESFFEIPDIDVKNYKNDTNRGEKVPNLLSKAQIHDIVPCFYVTWTDTAGRDRVSFGHTGMFRLAYEKSIGEHIPETLRTMSYEIRPDSLKRIREAGVPDAIIKEMEKFEKKIFHSKEFEKKITKWKNYQSIILKNTGKYDIAEAVFGNKTSFCGRVFFEDAVLEDGQKDVLLEENIPKLLQTPKPTTFQHYLVQTSDDIKQRRHYNDNTAIRGNKLYWHQTGENWIETDKDNRGKDKLITKIQPVKPGTKFSGRIRFENLSKVETGALLFALDLPEGCLHKLGMGKPIGLGSVRITSSLYLSHRQQRYKNLFAEWKKQPEKENNVSMFIDAFEKHVLKSIGEKKELLWETDRLKELKIMLNFKKGKTLCKKGKIRYMEIKGSKENEFKNRPILPLPGCL